MRAFENVSLKIDNNAEMDAKIVIDNKEIMFNYTRNRAISTFVRTKDCILRDDQGQPPDLVIFEYMPRFGSNFIIQIRFPSQQSKTAFIETACLPRSEDSANSSISSSSEEQNG